VTTWSPDFLGGYETTELVLPGAETAPGEPDDVDLVATLIRKSGPRAGARAVLYLHGWNDYFFQTHLADYLSDLGYDFYAVELVAGARYLRRICNVSSGGLLLEDRMTMKEPGSIIQLELPKRGAAPMKVSAEVVRVGSGSVGVRALGGASLEGLGGTIAL